MSQFRNCLVRFYQENCFLFTPVNFSNTEWSIFRGCSSFHVIVLYFKLFTYFKLKTGWHSPGKFRVQVKLNTSFIARKAPSNNSSILIALDISKLELHVPTLGYWTSQPIHSTSHARVHSPISRHLPRTSTAPRALLIIQRKDAR